ncbi:hypothetical protein B0H19DRAFT_1177675 [Mycena capillaripes]|nr:hypothetical protein B0H19DRAFT_1177675 [Mycena capillaripes]
MPRILPRLVKLPLSGNYPFPNTKPAKPPRKPVPPLHSVLLADHPRSVLLTPGNIITSSHDYVHHKAGAPVPAHRVPRRTALRKPDSTSDDRREMSAQEHAWFSSPYLRMLASPVRQCYLTHRYLPMDFMIRLAAMRVPVHLQQIRKGASKVLFPDGLQHPQFKRRKAGRGTYIMCWRESLTILSRPMKFKNLGASPRPRLAEHIAHLLRLRALQELLLLAKHLEAIYRTRTGPAPARPPVLRRLTRAEWAQLRTTGVLPYPGALAVLVVPPVNKDPTTKQRPAAAGAMSDRPPAAEPPRSPTRVAPPLSVLHPTRTPPPPSSVVSHVGLSTSEFWERTRRDRAAASAPATTLIQNLVPSENTTQVNEVRVPPHAEERVPLYNGVVLFPRRVQRARLHALLTRILGVEGAWRFSAAAGSGSEAGDGVAARKGDNKASHAFLVCASDEVDVAALGIALWRIRMWEGGGWRVRSVDAVEEEEEGEERWPWVEEIRA